MKPIKWSNEVKVGILVASTLVLAVGFAWLLGIQSPFQSTIDFYVTYNFAGGIEVGSPVRVSGIKVGKVKEIAFFVPAANQKVAKQDSASAPIKAGDEVIPLRLKVSISKDAARGVRRDSQFFINLAGIIGERYVEITPGSSESPEIKPEDVVQGIDPPRLDQLISQSYNLAGKVIDILNRNEGDITKSIELIYKLSKSLNTTLSELDKSKLFKTNIGSLIENLIAITKNMRLVTDKVDSKEGRETLRLMHDLLWRLEPLNSGEIRKFFQDEGIRARIF